MSIVSGGVSSKVLGEALKNINIQKPTLGFMSGYQTLMIDMNMPAGTTSRTEITSNQGNIQPKVLIVVLDDELTAEIRVVINGQEVPLVSDIYPPMMYIDVEGVYGAVETPKIIFIIKADTDTTKPNWGILEYYARVVPPG